HWLGGSSARIGEIDISVYAGSGLRQNPFARKSCQVLRGDRIEARDRSLVIHFGLRWINSAVIRIAIRYRKAEWRIELVHHRKTGDLGGGGGRCSGDDVKVGL